MKKGDDDMKPTKPGPEKQHFQDEPDGSIDLGGDDLTGDFGDLPPPPPPPSDTISINLADETTKPSPDKPSPTTPDQFPQIEGYEIVDVLGQGGMGVVYRAKDLRLDRMVAIKTIHIATTTPESRMRFATEAKSLAQVQNAGVAQIFETGHIADVPYIVMELVDGPSLDKVTDRKPIEPQRAATIVKKLARTLEICHQKGVIHRDLKPSNVLMEDGEHPKLTDFGLAKFTDETNRVTKTGDIMGTPSYMSPEQASGVVKSIGSSADVYGAGALLYELLTGAPPFSSPDPLNTMMMVLTKPPVAPRTAQPNLSADIETIALKCLEKKPAHRYSSCAELGDDLERFLSGAPIKAKPTPTYRKLAMWSRRRPAAASLIVVGIIVLIGAFAGIGAHNAALQKELDRSQRIIVESRNLSRWLLEDFTNILESRDGITFVRSKLADRTQTHLDALLKEAADDEELRTELALAFSRLASVRGNAGAGSLGDFEQGRQNLIEAERLVGSLKNRKSSVATQVLVSIGTQRANLAIAKNDLDETQKQIDKVRTLIEDPTNGLDQMKRRGTNVDLTGLDFELARRRGDRNAAMEAVDRIRKLTDEILNDDEVSANGKIITLHACVRIQAQWFEVEGESEKMNEILEEARKHIDEIIDSEDLNHTAQTAIGGIEHEIANTLFRQKKFSEALEAYTRYRDTWKDVLGRDAKNHIVSFNLGKGWEDMGICHYQLEDLDAADVCYQEAQKYYQLSIKQRGGTPETDRSYLYLLGSRGQLLLHQGKLEEGQRLIQRKIDGLTRHFDDVNSRWAVGDEYLVLAASDCRQFADTEIVDFKTDFPEAKAKYEKAIASLDRVIAHFDQMESEGVINEPMKSQRETAKAYKKALKEIFDDMRAAYEAATE